MNKQAFAGGALVALGLLAGRVTEPKIGDNIKRLNAIVNTFIGVAASLKSSIPDLINEIKDSVAPKITSSVTGIKSAIDDIGTTKDPAAITGHIFTIIDKIPPLTEKVGLLLKNNVAPIVGVVSSGIYVINNDTGLKTKTAAVGMLNAGNGMEKVSRVVRSKLLPAARKFTVSSIQLVQQEITTTKNFIENDLPQAMQKMQQATARALTSLNQKERAQAQRT